jgi:hypothetical protein
LLGGVANGFGTGIGIVGWHGANPPAGHAWDRRAAAPPSAKREAGRMTVCASTLLST